MTKRGASSPHGLQYVDAPRAEGEAVRYAIIALLRTMIEAHDTIVDLLA